MPRLGSKELPRGEQVDQQEEGDHIETRWLRWGRLVMALVVWAPAWDEGAIQGDGRTPVTPCSHRPFMKRLSSHYAVTLMKARNCMAKSLKPGIMTPGWVMLGLPGPMVSSWYHHGATSC